MKTSVHFPGIHG